jgi:hypothetical protein
MVINANLQALFNLLCSTPPTTTRRTTLINPAMVTYFNCGKNGYFALSCPELKNISDIKEIKEEEEETSNKLKKRRTLGKNSPLKYPINLKKINLSQLIGGKRFIVLYTVSQNKYRVNITALINTKVNSFAFINTAYINNVIKFLNVTAT